MSLMALSIIVTNWKLPNPHQQKNKYTWYSHTVNSIKKDLQLHRREYIVYSHNIFSCYITTIITYNYMQQQGWISPQLHPPKNIKWKKPDTNRIHIWFHLYVVQKQAKVTCLNWRSRLPGFLGRNNWKGRFLEDQDWLLN